MRRGLKLRRPDDPRLEADPQDDVIQLYTSGTTGLPKGVRLTNRNYLTLSSSRPIRAA